MVIKVNKCVFCEFQFFANHAVPEQKALVKCMCSLLCLYCFKSVRCVFGLGAQQCCLFSLLLMLRCCPLVSDAFVIVLDTL